MISGLTKDLLEVYVPLVVCVGLGIVLGCKLPKAVPLFLGKALFWVGVPLSIFAFLRQADLSGSVWLAPVVAWIALLMGAGLAWLWMQGSRYPLQQKSRQTRPRSWRDRWWRRLGNTRRFDQRPPDSATPPLPALANDSADFPERQRDRLWLSVPPSTGDPSMSEPPPPSPLSSSTWSQSAQGSFLLATMFGNTGYLGYPVALAIVGPQYFAWAIFYDTLGTTIGAYGLGVVLAARYGMGTTQPAQLAWALINNPALWGFTLGLVLREVPFPDPVEMSLKGFSWGMIFSALVLLGMRLSQLRSGQSVGRAMVGLGIKMLIVPLVLGLGLSILGITGAPQLVIVLQMAMPPAFATLVITEAYNLDRNLTVTCLAMGTGGFLLTLPLWLWLFGT